MRQLGELQKRAEDFKKLDAELVFVFREESLGTEGLTKIRDSQKTDFVLALDWEKKTSEAYSPGKGTFNNYVVDKSGKIAAIIDGTLRERATADELTKVLKELQTRSEGAQKTKLVK